jgi:hypothetical protein
MEKVVDGAQGKVAVLAAKADERLEKLKPSQDAESSETAGSGTGVRDVPVVSTKDKRRESTGSGGETRKGIKTTLSNMFRKSSRSSENTPTLSSESGFSERVGPSSTEGTDKKAFIPDMEDKQLHDKPPNIVYDPTTGQNVLTTEVPSREEAAKAAAKIAPDFPMGAGATAGLGISAQGDKPDLAMEDQGPSMKGPSMDAKGVSEEAKGPSIEGKGNLAEELVHSDHKFTKEELASIMREEVNKDTGEKPSTHVDKESGIKGALNKMFRRSSRSSGSDIQESPDMKGDKGGEGLKEEGRGLKVDESGVSGKAGGMQADISKSGEMKVGGTEREMKPEISMDKKGLSAKGGGMSGTVSKQGDVKLGGVGGTVEQEVDKSMPVFDHEIDLSVGGYGGTTGTTGSATMEGQKPDLRKPLDVTAPKAETKDGETSPGGIRNAVKGFFRRKSESGPKGQVSKDMTLEEGSKSADEETGDLAEGQHIHGFLGHRKMSHTGHVHGSLPEGQQSNVPIAAQPSGKVEGDLPKGQISAGMGGSEIQADASKGQVKGTLAGGLVQGDMEAKMPPGQLKGEIPSASVEGAGGIGAPGATGAHVGKGKMSTGQYDSDFNENYGLSSKPETTKGKR